jgi:CHASE3 domain sensor protein
MSPGDVHLERSGRRLPGAVSGTFAIALGMFVVAAVALGVNLARQRDSYGWVQHTNEVLRNISAVERAILEGESGERGYLLTGESSYLNSYSLSQAEIPRLLEALGQAVLAIRWPSVPPIIV